MTGKTLDRRDVLKATAAAATIGVPGAAHAAYDPAAQFDLVVSEVELHRNSARRMLMARIYQPKGPGPFPTVLDLHGGAWNRKDRFAEEPMDRALAASGLLVVAVDMTISPEAPYPACVQDANWSVRWLKTNAGKWNGDGSKIGVYGSSSGGHVAELLALRPHDQRYGALPLTTGPQPDATVAWVAMRSPVSNTFARYQNAERRKNEGMIKNNKVFFVPWETIHESNPQEIPRAQGEGHPAAAAHHAGRARRQRAAGDAAEIRRDLPGGRRRLRLPPVREFRPRMGRRARPTDRQGAREVAKEFIARQLGAVKCTSPRASRGGVREADGGVSGASSSMASPISPGVDADTSPTSLGGATRQFDSCRKFRNRFLATSASAFISQRLVGRPGRSRWARGRPDEAEDSAGAEHVLGLVGGGAPADARGGGYPLATPRTAASRPAARDPAHALARGPRARRCRTPPWHAASSSPATEPRPPRPARRRSRPAARPCRRSSPAAPGRRPPHDQRPADAEPRRLRPLGLLALGMQRRQHAIERARGRARRPRSRKDRRRSSPAATSARRRCRISPSRERSTTASAQ